MTSCAPCDLITCPRIKRNIILAQLKDISPQTRSALRKLDPLTVLAVSIFPPNCIAQNENPKTNADLTTKEVDLGWVKVGEGFSDWKKTRQREFRKKVSPEFSSRVLHDDDFFGEYKCLEKLTFGGMKSTLLFPMKDSAVFITAEEAQLIAKDLDLVEGKALPVSYDTHFDMLSDESFSRIFFYSLGAPLIAVQKKNDPAVNSRFGPFVVDMPLQNLKMRRNYRPYGARIHFGEDQMPTAIFDYAEDKYFEPGEEGWDESKLLAKVTSFTLVTAREHLIWCHLVLSNTITTASTLKLAPSHPLRRLLTIFTYGATKVNLNAFGTLVTEEGILHRSTGLQYESLQEVFDQAYEQCNIYQPFTEHELAPEVAKLAEDGKFPYITEGREYWNIVYEFVTAWIGRSGDKARDEQAMAFYKYVQQSTKGQSYELPDYTSDEDMIKLITQSIFTVTAYHELIGCVVDYIKLPSRAGFRVTKDDKEIDIDIQSWLLGAIIGAATSVRMPALMKPFDNFFGAGGAPMWERELWSVFIHDLGVQSKNVQAADSERSIEFKYFDPARFECSVSV